MKRIIPLTAMVGCVLALLAGTGPVKVAQTVKLKAGQWNLFHLSVQPTVGADEFFADWPVDTVGMYDADSFRLLQQYSGAYSTEGAVRGAMRKWVRGDSGASDIGQLMANTVYMCRPFNNAEIKVYGLPRAARIMWHPSSTNLPANFVGVSLQDGVKVRLEDYFRGCDADVTEMRKVGGTAEAGPTDQIVFGELQAADGDAFAIDCKNVSDWSGAVHVSPVDGVDFGKNGTRGSVVVRNDGRDERTVEMRIVASANEGGVAMPTLRGDCFHVRERSVVSDGWHLLAAETVMTKKLAAGARWELDFAFDRVKTAAVAAGETLGGVLEFRDVDGGSGMVTRVPLQATADGGEWALSSWPKGLWIAEVEFDRVSQQVRKNTMKHGVKSGGSMKVRLPMYVAGAGSAPVLLQRVTMAEVGGSNRLFGASAAMPAGAKIVRRISSVHLPTDVNSCVYADDSEPAVFGSNAAFSFTVGERSRVNPFYHAQHPMHDGLDADWKDNLPSGDVPANWNAAVKPELFSITNRIHLVWKDNDAAAWNPAETLSGECTWTLGGLVIDGEVQMQGEFTMKRVIAAEVALPPEHSDNPVISK